MAYSSAVAASREVLFYSALSAASMLTVRSVDPEYAPTILTLEVSVIPKRALILLMNLVGPSLLKKSSIGIENRAVN